MNNNKGGDVKKKPDLSLDDIKGEYRNEFTNPYLHWISVTRKVYGISLLEVKKLHDYLIARIGKK